MNYPSPTIAAIATAPGRGGVGVIRVSGTGLMAMAEALTGKSPRPRYATLTDFSPPTAAPSIPACCSTFLLRPPLPARTCWNCKATAARWS